jgi:hypothetical protein
VVHRSVESCLALEHRAALGVLDELWEQTLDDQALGKSRRMDRPRQVDLGRAPDGKPRVEPEWAEFHWRARERSRHVSPARLFAKRHPADECIYAEPTGTVK